MAGGSVVPAFGNGDTLDFLKVNVECVVLRTMLSVSLVRPALTVMIVVSSSLNPVKVTIELEHVDADPVVPKGL